MGNTRKLIADRESEYAEVCVPPTATFSAAEKISRDARAPYSNFRVGCAIKWANPEGEGPLSEGWISKGYNIEDSVRTGTVHAEEAAIVDGLLSFQPDMPWEIREVAVFCLDSKVAYPPCGMCRQRFTEYVSVLRDAKIYFGCPTSWSWAWLKEELLPLAYRPAESRTTQRSSQNQESSVLPKGAK